MPSTKCPGCGRTDFETVGGMRVHYSLLDDGEHDGSISYETIECEGCGTDMNVLKSSTKHYCSDCASESVWIDDEEVREKMSEVKSGEKNPMYGLRGEDHPAHGNVLSDETRKAMSESKTGMPRPDMYGEKNPSWKESTTTEFSQKFYENRPKALERDGYECRVCGVCREEHYSEYNGDLVVHHIKPRSEFMEEGMIRPPDEAGEMSNLFTVCRSCHIPVEAGLIPIPDNGNQMSGMDW